jgi:N-acetylated-alpha-linked acidic dipeptidase
MKRADSVATAVFAGLAVGVVGLAASGTSGAQDGPAGRKDEVTTQQARYEGQLAAEVSADNIGSYIKRLTARPNYPGAPYAESVANQTLGLFKEWGWDARIETFSVMFPLAVEQTVELLGAAPYRAKIHEPPIAGDAYTDNQAEILQPQFVYGPDGDITAPLVYVNLGLRDDYLALQRLGVSVKGKIVIARIGSLWRGGKVELAAEHGAAGIIIYSDPKEDGYFRDETYPAGPGRTADGVQRGSVLYGKYPGDPLTPDVAALPGVKRLSKDDPRTTVARIPAVPMSYSDAQHLLASLGGQVAPESWRGALPITYRVGPSDAAVHLKVKYDWKLISWRDVIARLPGNVWPEELIIRGNHRDGWVYGAHDPHSGHSEMLEEARALGKLYRAGWRPKRTIIYASWEGEEQGLIGSTEWTEAHRQQLLDHAVVYMNTDTMGMGSVNGTGSASLAAFISAIAAGVPDPNSGVSSLERAKIAARNSIYELPSSIGSGIPVQARTYDFRNDRLVLGAPGYSSDHQSFVSNLGVATLNMSFTGDVLAGGEYHTSYDDYAYYARFIDPGFKYGRAAAQLNGTAVFRLSEADVLPLQFDATAEAVAGEVNSVKRLYQGLVERARKTNESLDNNAFTILRDPARQITPPERESVPVLDFAPLEAASVAVGSAAQKFMAARPAPDARLSKSQVAKINRVLLQVERAFNRQSGLPGRPYYKNELYSPGRLWDTVPFPAVGDAMLDGQWDAARAQLPLATQTVLGIAKAIDAATADLVAEKSQAH